MKYLKILSGTIFVLMILPSVSAVAQEGSAVDADSFLSQNNEKEEPTGADGAQSEISDAKKELEDENILAQKLDLAKKMHQIRPTREQVESAVMQASRSLPEGDRQNFVNAMRGILNYKAIERISIDAMIETFTLKELEAMVEYYSKPEAQSASQKTMLWAQKVQPEIVRMIDKAILRIRTGGAP